MENLMTYAERGYKSELVSRKNIVKATGAASDNFWMSAWESESFPSSLTVRFSDDIDFLSPKLFYKKQGFSIETSEGHFIIDEKLSSIYNSINESKSLLELKDDWDGEDAIGCNYSVYDRAINILLKYSKNVLKYYGVAIHAPEINLAKDGSIDLEWRNKNGILLINILNVKEFEAHFYGNDFKTETIIKGFLKSYTVNRNLSYWMQNLVL